MLKLNAGERILPELAFISLGSNIEPEAHLPRALTRLRQLGRLLACSGVYQNPAIAKEPQPDYLNAAVLIETELSPLKIRERLREIEAQLGRVRTKDKNAPRTIDLDLCLYGDLQMESPELSLPDPDILRRPHLAKTMADLHPSMNYPGTSDTLAQIADALHPGSQLVERLDVLLSTDPLDQAGSTDA